MAISVSPVWPGQCTIHVHKAHEADGIHTTEARNLSNPVPGRYANNGKIKTACQGTPSHSHVVSVIPWVHNQSKEKHTLSWNWCINRTVIHAEHLPGRPRHSSDSTDWMFQREIFKSYKPARAIHGQRICSRTNSQLHLYCSLKPDPEALAVDALLILEGSLSIHVSPI